RCRVRRRRRGSEADRKACRQTRIAMASRLDRVPRQIFLGSRPSLLLSLAVAAATGRQVYPPYGNSLQIDGFDRPWGNRRAEEACAHAREALGTVGGHEPERPGAR